MTSRAICPTDFCSFFFICCAVIPLSVDRGGLRAHKSMSNPTAFYICLSKTCNSVFVISWSLHFKIFVIDLSQRLLFTCNDFFHIFHIVSVIADYRVWVCFHCGRLWLRANTSFDILMIVVSLIIIFRSLIFVNLQKEGHSYKV